MKNYIGTTMIKRKTFQLREDLKAKIPSLNKVLDNIKQIVDKCLDVYNAYRFIILFFLWIILNLLNSGMYIVNTVGVLSVALLSIVVKYLNFIEKRFYLTKDFSKAIFQLDSLISECIQEYSLMNGIAGLTFINDKEETKIRTEVTNMVVAKMSDQLVSKLIAQYNENVIHEIVATRVYIIVMNLVIEINKDKPTSDKAPANDQFDISKMIANMNNQ